MTLRHILDTITQAALDALFPQRRALRALRERRLDVDLLMVVAAVAAASIAQVHEARRADDGARVAR